jgi:hypothetical protein
MHLSQEMKRKVNKRVSRLPSEWLTRDDWIESENGIWSCENGRYTIVDDPKLGKVVAEKKIIGYTMT